jgi:hypothetical protein
MARKTGAWLTGFALIVAILGISFIGLNDVSAYKQDVSKSAIMSGYSNISKTAGQEEALPKFAGQNKMQVSPQPYGGRNIIEFSNGYSINTDQGEPNLPSDLKYSTPKNDEAGYYIVQFSGPIQDSWRRDLEKSGAEVMFYLPNYAFVVRMNESTRKSIAGSKSEVKWTGLYQPAYKISTRITQRAAKGGTVRAAITLFSPEEISSSIKEIETLMGKKIYTQSVFEWAPGKFNKKIFVDITNDKIKSLANITGVAWIEPMAVFRPLNDRTQVTVQNGATTANNRPIWSRGIQGEGQIVTILDTGCRPDHDFFKDGFISVTTWYWNSSHRKVVAQQPAAYADEAAIGWSHGTMSRIGDESKNQYHGTHVSGSIAGNDTTFATTAYDGMAKNAKILFLDGGGDSGSVYGTQDLNRVGSWSWDSAYKYLGGQRSYISSHSWGDSSANGRYDGNGMEIDQFMWSHKDFLFLFADDNDGSKTQPGSKAGAPAIMKNGVAVGALTQAGASGVGGANSKASFSSWGRHTDGRLNPTVTAPGSGIISALNTSDNGTQSMDGTSMATPLTAGATALLRQYFTDGWYPSGTKVTANGFIPSGALMKAVLAISGDSTGGVYASFYPDSLYGFGRVNLDTALYFAGNAVKLIIDDNRVGLMTGEVKEYLLNIPASATGLKICLNWTDYPGNPTAAKALVNDLDLDAYNSSATRHRGNRYNATVPRQTNTSATNNDSVDVIEGIKVVSPATGTWRITVTGKNVAFGPQPYALAITYKTAVAGFGTMGKVFSNKPMYGVPTSAGAGDTIKIEVNDANNTAASSNVLVYARRVETSPETVSCTKVGDGLFRGSIVLFNGNPVNGDGRLSVDCRDTVYAKYVDSDPAGTDSLYALVDVYGLTIYNVLATDPAPPNASAKLINWTTNEQATQKIYYGTTPALGGTFAIDTPYVMNHKLLVTGLTPNTNYYFDVESRDYRGNTVRDDNGGRHYMFTTGSSSGADVFVCLLNENTAGADFANPAFLSSALDAGGWSYDWWSCRDNGVFSLEKLKLYKAVFFQVGQEGYPTFTPAQRETIKLYHNAGARFTVSSHDLGWDTWKHQGPGTDLNDDTIFCRNFLHFTYKGDITATTWTTIRGAPSDPISGSFTGGVPYTPWRSGAAGDSILLSGSGAAGTGSYVWHGNVTADSCAIKWESNNNMGSSGNGVWGGYPTRVVTNAFEITQIDATIANSANRSTILNNMFIWLIGHDHPDVSISTPVAGNTYTSGPVIAWTSSVYGGAAVDTTWVEYSNNGGSSWNQLAKSISLTSPYNWDISSIENGTQYQVRVRVNDKNVYPSMAGSDTVGNFTIKRVGGDNTGPIVVLGSISFVRSPVGNQSGNGFMIQAVASDSSTGLSNIAAVKCSVVVSGTPRTMLLKATDGSFNSIQESVNGGMMTSGWPTGTYTVYLRAQDASASKSLSNWGALSSITVNVIDGISTPAAVELSYFTATANEQGIMLNWATQSEKNTERWIIGRSQSFSGPYVGIKEIVGQGTSNAPHEYSYLDGTVEPNKNYCYRLTEISGGIEVSVYTISANSLNIPVSFAFKLSSPQPNPSRGQAKISYQIADRSEVKLKVYNITGQLVRTLVNEVKSAGSYAVTWDGRNEKGQTMSNGIYFINLESGSLKATRKMTVIR